MQCMRHMCSWVLFVCDVEVDDESRYELVRRVIAIGRRVTRRIGSALT